MKIARLLGMAATLSVASGCASVVKSAHTSDEWKSVDQNRVKRLVVVTQPYPAGNEKVGEMWSSIAARRVDLKRDFIIKDKQTLSAESPFDPKTLCGEGLDGVLWLKPNATSQGDGIEAEVQGVLLRCVDGQEVWTAEAAGSWSSHEEKLAQTVKDYVAEFGPEVEPFVVGSYHLLNDTLDTLPNPVLTEDEKDEKIENTQ